MPLLKPLLRAYSHVQAVQLPGSTTDIKYRMGRDGLEESND